MRVYMQDIYITKILTCNTHLRVSFYLMNPGNAETQQIDTGISYTVKIDWN